MTLPLDRTEFAAVFVREPDQPGEQGDVDARVVLVADLARTRQVRATTLVAGRADGPFAPMAHALSLDPRLRAMFARALALPSLRHWRRARLVGLAGLVPLAMLVELDLERSMLGTRTAGVVAATGLVALGVVLWDLLRSVPVWPRTSGIVFVAAAARFATFLAYSCGKTRPAGAAVYAAGATALAAGAALCVFAPTRRRLVRECLDALGVEGGGVPLARDASPPGARLLTAAMAAGAALPVLLALAQWAGVPLLVRMAGFAAYALVAPACVERCLEQGAGSARAVPSPHTWPGTEGLKRASVAALVAFVLTAGLATGARHALDALAAIAECLHPGGAPANLARELAQEQRIEIARNASRDASGLAFVTMTVLLVPLVEERVYRGLVQRILARRFGDARAIVAAALVFGLAHLGVYRVAIYQTCLLGLSFGVAYAEGGIVAAVLAHALWNLHLLY